MLQSPADDYLSQTPMHHNGAAHQNGHNEFKTYEEFNNNFWETEGPIVQPIPDNLMVGDYIEINGICRGPDVIIELITEEQQRSGRNDVLPLHVHLHAGGPVLVKNYSKEKVNRQEYNHRMGMQQNLAFELCIYALDEGYEIKLNGETVCMHKHVVRLEDVAAITMDGDADFTSIEFKDTSGEDPEGEYTADEPQPGFMRVQEMRESFSRKPGSPIMVRSSIRRSQRSNQVGSPTPIGRSEWKTSSDLSKPVIDIDTVSRPSYDSAGHKVAPVNAAFDSHGVSTYDASAKKRSSGIPSIGGRKSIHLDEAKLEEYSVVGGSQSRVIAGDAHDGAYRILDDEARPVLRQGANTMYVGSASNLSASAASLQDKKKKRSSLFGSKFRKSKGSESDLSVSGTVKDKKSKGSRSLLKFGKSRTSASENDLRISSSTYVDGPTTNSASMYGQSSTMSLRPNYLGVGVDRAPVPGPVPKSVAKLPAAEIAAYVAGQKAVPEFEWFMLTDGQTRDSEIYVDHPADLEQTRSITASEPSMVTPVSSTAPVMRSQEGPIYLGVGVDRDPVPGPVPKSVMKAAAPEIAGYVAGQKAVPEFENFTVVGPMWAASRDSQMVYDQAPLEKTGAPVEVPPTVDRKLKGTAPEKADILYESGRAKFEPNVNLTGGIQEPRIRSSEIEATYTEVDPGTGTSYQPPSVVMDTKPTKLKGPAPEIASQLQDAYSARMGHLPETTLAGDLSPQKPRSTYIERPAYDIDRVISQPSYVEPVRPVEINRSASVPFPSYGRDDDTESLVHSDNEYILTVGKSSYYLERQRSLKKYQSKRSRRKEREARRSMGLPMRNDSIRSSISSLTESELNLCRQSRPFISQPDLTEQRVYSSRANMSKVYAEPPMREPIPRPITETIVEATELKKNNFGAKFPLPLISGRSANLTGHFVRESPKPQTCTIRLWTDELTESNSFSAMTVELWSTGALTVYGTKNTNPTCLTNWKGAGKTSNLSDRKNFKINLHARGLYSAVSLNDFITLLLPQSFNPIHLNHLELENFDNAELDQFSVTNNLILPLDLIFPNQSHRDETQTVALKTQMTADTKCLSAAFETQMKKEFKVVFNFEQYQVSVKTAKEGGQPILCGEIPFVPEQIRDIKMTRYTSDNRFSVSANGTELLSQTLPLARPVGKFSRVRINGQLVLLNAELK